MKYFLSTLLFLFSFSLSAQTQHYEKAYSDLENMLVGNTTLDFNKAVFIVENAYFDNSLNYADFDNKLNRIKEACDVMIAKKGLSGYKTAGNWAIFDWMSKPLPENNYRACEYDFDDFLGKNNHQNIFVTRLLNEKIGNCLSMPLLYKCLANKLGVEARIALAPNHMWIRHIDEQGKWANLELTSGETYPDELVRNEFDIPALAIQRGTYMKGLSERESVAFLLNQLAEGYEAKFGKLDDFTDNCANLSIMYYPTNAVAYMTKSNRVTYRLMELKKAKNYGKEYHAKGKKFQEYERILKSLGATEMDMDAYIAWIKKMRNK
jgi:hypothetical protein